MPEGIVIRPQRHDWDCGVAAIAMLLGVSYGDVAQKVKEIIDDPRLKSRGLILKQIEEIIEAFGRTPKRIYKQHNYLNNATGILGLNGGMCGPYGHWVVIKAGLILDPSGGEAWELEDYLKTAKCRTATLVVLE